MKTRTTSIILAALAALFLLPAAAKADSLVISPLTSPATPAVIVTGASATAFTGTLTNDSTGTWSLLGASYTFGGPPTVVINVNPFNNNAPLTLGAGLSYGPATFFDVFAAIGTTPGNYGGSFSVSIGDAQGNFLFDLTEEFFIVVREGGTQPIPEPATMFLLGSGLAGLAAARRRKRRQADAP